MSTIIQTTVRIQTAHSSQQLKDTSRQTTITPTTRNGLKRPPNLLHLMVGMGIAIAPFLLPTASMAQSNQSDVTGVVGGIEIHQNVQNPESSSGGTGGCGQEVISAGTRRFALNPLSYGNIESGCPTVTLGPSNSTEGVSSLGSGTGGGDTVTAEDISTESDTSVDRAEDTRSVLW